MGAAFGIKSAIVFMFPFVEISLMNEKAVLVLRVSAEMVSCQPPNLEQSIKFDNSGF